MEAESILLVFVEVLPMGNTVFAVAPIVDVTCGTSEVAGNVELSNRGSNEVFPAPTPTAGTLPFSLPEPVGKPSMAEAEGVDGPARTLVPTNELVEVVTIKTEELLVDDGISAADAVPFCLCNSILVVL